MWDLEQGAALASFASESEIIALAATPSGARVIASTSTGPVHLLRLCGYEWGCGGSSGGVTRRREGRSRWMG